MNKTDRQLAIMLELQRNKILKAEDLASLFETSVRTIYRDIQALSEMGVPILGAPGQGYSLMEGYFLPPVRFNADEAVALLMGSDFIEQRLDGDYEKAARAARRKIEAILPEPVREESTRIQETMRLLQTGEPASSWREKNNVALTRLAMIERRKLRIAYMKRMPETDGNRKSKGVRGTGIYVRRTVRPVQVFRHTEPCFADQHPAPNDQGRKRDTTH